jgi:hypothetical protein
MNAILDALAPLGITDVAMPATPSASGAHPRASFEFGEPQQGMGEELEEDHHLPPALQHPESVFDAAGSMSGVTSSSLPVGDYPTFLSVLAIGTG